MTNIIQKINRMERTQKLYYAFILGVLLYWVIFKKLGAKVTETTTTITGATLPSGTSQPIKYYTAKYFKDSEYFGTNPIPAQYYENWVTIVKMLDKIRTAFASAVLIKVGYLPWNGTDKETLQNQCKFVVITAQNKDNDFLYTQALTLKLINSINPVTLQKLSDGSILITI